MLCAASLDEAVAKVNEHAGEIHLLITDVVMPEMNGRDPAERLRGIAGFLAEAWLDGV